MPHDHHEHDHMSPSGHPYRADNDVPLSYWQTMEIAVRELLVEKGITTPVAVQAEIDAMDARSPADGAQVVARAWTDPDYKGRLLADGTGAMEEMGFKPEALKLVVVENTDTVHNMIVCTLCSCYPRTLLGLPPDWYKSRAYRSRAVREPRKVLSEFGVDLPDSVQVRVHDSTADMRYLVLPRRPDGTEGWSTDKLAQIVSRDSMIGVALPSTP
ncbi:MAG: nitrile hydratase subunit alpha [Pseudomonadota bacterium]